LFVLDNLFDLALNGQSEGSLLGEQASSPCLVCKQAGLAWCASKQAVSINTTFSTLACSASNPCIFDGKKKAEVGFEPTTYGL
jgi:hypothetical protein